jgi:diguanylate cyclase (GGDEF)-like protein
MISTHRPDGRFDYATETWSELVGVPMDQVVGHLPAESAHPDDVALLVENRARGLIIARFGGDEFVVLALDCGDMRAELVHRIEAATDAHNASAAQPYSLSMSLGIAQFDPFAPITLDALMAESDMSLYEAKRRRAAARELMA